LLRIFGRCKEPSAGLMGCGVPISPQSRSATDKLGDTARAENWRNLGGKKGSHPFLGASSLGHLGRARGPFPSRASLLSYSPLWVLLRRSTDIYPKELARGMREFFNSLLGAEP
jgi:hypothetical protein